MSSPEVSGLGNSGVGAGAGGGGGAVATSPSDFKGVIGLEDFVRRSDRQRRTVTRWEPPKPPARARRQSSESSSSEDSSSSDDSDYAPSRRARRKDRQERRRRVDAETSAVRRAARSLRNVAPKNYAESDSDAFMDDYDRAVAREQARAQTEEDEGNVMEMIVDDRPAGPGAGPGADREYLIKWKGSAHIHNTWVTQDEVRGLKGYKRLTNYITKARQKKEYMDSISLEEREQEMVWVEMQRQHRSGFTRVERIVEERLDDDDSPEYLVLWENLPYSECTWESPADIQTYNSKIDAFLAREDRISKSKGKTYPSGRDRPFRKLTQQPQWLSKQGLSLRDYQLDGLNWLQFTWSQHRNGILADEMGLGKTIQCVVFLSQLSRTYHLMGPFLIVVPLSTIPAWKREFAKWAPFLNVVTYVGNQQSRAIIRDHEFYVGSGTGGRGRAPRKFRLNALVTTYEMVMKDKAHLGSIKWKYMMVDEAHRLKNDSSKLYETLSAFHTANRLLITGTPLQNTMRELWCLLHFLNPDEFNDFDAFNEGLDIQEGRGIASIHAILKPYILRRDKKKVLKSLPQKTERILRVQRTYMQRDYYRWVITHNFRELNKGERKQSLMNTVMELKKVCNHPFLMAAGEEQGRKLIQGDIKANPGKTYAQARHDAIRRNSGKMLLLDQLLRKLKSQGHRVLIFSQMVRMLNLLADYLSGAGFQFQRLDGSMPSLDRQQAMDHFNKPDSNDFCFLLSTRAGGLGVNLATADTVVIFDSDWNPQNDLQAMARCHRIGQTQSVNVYRFVTKDSVEESIIERAKKKMILDHLVIQRMDTSGRTTFNKKENSVSFDKTDLTKILKFGAKSLFEEEAKRSGSGSGEASGEASASPDKEDDVNLDEILSRAETKTEADEGENAESDALLSAFNVLDFSTNDLAKDLDAAAETAQQQRQTAAAVAEEDDDWDRIVPDHLIPEEQKREANAIPLYLPPRVRAKVNYSESAMGKAYQNDDSDEEEDESSEDEAVLSKSAKKSKKKKPRGVSKADVRAINKGLQRFGSAARAVDWLRKTAWKDRAPGRSLSDENATQEASAILQKAQAAYDAKLSANETKAVAPALTKPHTPSKPTSAQPASAQPAGGDAKQPTKSPTKKRERLVVEHRGVTVDVDTLIKRARERSILDRQVKAQSTTGGDAQGFRLRGGMRPVQWKLRHAWGTKQDSMLMLGVYIHGMGAWDDIISDQRLDLSRFILAPVQAPKQQPAQPIKQETQAQDAKVDASSGNAPGSTKTVAASAAPARLVKNSQLKTRVAALFKHMLNRKKPKPKKERRRPGMKRGAEKPAQGSGAKKRPRKANRPGAKTTTKTSKNGGEKRRAGAAGSAKKKKRKVAAKKVKSSQGATSSTASKVLASDGKYDKKIFSKCQERLLAAGAVHKSWKKLYSKYHTKLGSDKANKHVVTVGSFVRGEIRRKPELENYYWHLASICIKRKHRAFREVYRNTILEFAKKQNGTV